MSRPLSCHFVETLPQFGKLFREVGWKEATKMWHKMIFLVLARFSYEPLKEKNAFQRERTFEFETGRLIPSKAESRLKPSGCAGRRGKPATTTKARQPADAAQIAV
jgi:hypothetical protein